MLRVLRQRRVGEVLAITLAAWTSMFTITPLLALFLRPKIFVSNRKEFPTENYNKNYVNS